MDKVNGRAALYPGSPGVLDITGCDNIAGIVQPRIADRRDIAKIKAQAQKGRGIGKGGLKIFKALSRAAQQGWIESMHDCSEGGLAAAVAEMAFSGGFGAAIDANKILYEGKEKRDDIILFSESNTRFIVEIDPKNQIKFEKFLKNIPFSLIWKVKSDAKFCVQGFHGQECININMDDLKEAWQRPLRW